MQSIIETFISWGPWGVLILAIIDSAGIPIPTGVDFLLVALSASHRPIAYWSAALAVVGSLIGTMALFYIARKGGEVYLERHTLSRSAQRFRRWFQHYGLLTIFIPALLPIPLPLKIFVLSAGALGIPPATFLMVLFAARIPRYFGLAFLGTQVGTYSLTYLRQHMFVLMAIAVGLFVFLYGLIKMKDRARKAAENAG